MRHKIFTNIFVSVMIVFVLCFSLSMWAMYSYFSAQSMQELKISAEYIGSAVENCGMDFLGKVNGSNNSRITYVDSDGTVLYDSVADKNSMDNHADREEIAEAMKNGSGESTRYSETLYQKTLNYALRLKDGTVLRVSSDKYTVFTLIGNMLYHVFFILVLAVILSVLLAARVSGGVTKPINNIDLASPDERDVYQELRPLVKRINAQNRQIQQQLNELKSEHEKQNKMRKEFTANVSHELKTPLTSISGYAEIIRAGFVKPEDISRFAGKIYDETQRLITLVGDIINLSRLDEKEIEISKSEIDLYEISEGVIEHLHPAAEKRGITFTLCGTHRKINGVPQIIEEIIYNLCDNAIKYNKENGKVSVTVDGDKDITELTVSDTGIGIPDDEIDRVFERFYRVDKSHSKEIGGTGLGLSIVKHGVSYHGAEISIKSKLGEGTTIKISFTNI